MKSTHLETEIKLLATEKFVREIVKLTEESSSIAYTQYYFDTRELDFAKDSSCVRYRDHFNFKSLNVIEYKALKTGRGDVVRVSDETRVDAERDTEFIDIVSKVNRHFFDVYGKRLFLVAHNFVIREERTAQDAKFVIDHVSLCEVDDHSYLEVEIEEGEEASREAAIKLLEDVGSSVESVGQLSGGCLSKYEMTLLFNYGTSPFDCQIEDVFREVFGDDLYNVINYEASLELRLKNIINLNAALFARQLESDNPTNNGEVNEDKNDI